MVLAGISTRVTVRACDTVQTLTTPPSLRSADALHLANARDHGFKEIYSHDKAMLESAKYFGLKDVDIISM